HGQQFAKLPPTLLRYDESFYWKWMERAAENKPQVAAIARRYQSVIDQLVQLPATFIHGEFYPSNILVQGGQIRPVDWETAAIGPALMDVAALCAGRFDDDRRREIAKIYGAQEHDVDLCRLHL